MPSRAPLLDQEQLARLGEHGVRLYKLLMNQSPDVDTIDVQYREEDIGIEGETLVPAGAIIEMMKDEWLDATILQIFSM